MTDKELKRLSRGELLEMLIHQTRKNEALAKQLEKAKEELEEKRLLVTEAGDLAQAVLKVNGVFEAAAQASSQYLENIKAMEIECEEKCRTAIEEAESKAEVILADANKRAEEIVNQAIRRADKINSKKTQGQSKGKRKKK